MSDLIERMGHTMDRWDVEEPREDWWSYQKEFDEAAQAITTLTAEIERLREALERVTTDCQLVINVLGNSPAEFDSVRKSFEIVRDRARAALKGQP
jgi:chromosome segregation ATPase